MSEKLNDHELTALFPEDNFLTPSQRNTIINKLNRRKRLENEEKMSEDVGEANQSETQSRSAGIKGQFIGFFGFLFEIQISQSIHNLLQIINLEKI